MIVPIGGVPRDYAWGSTTAIQRMLGLPEDGRPIAELWFGGHPDDPSPADTTTLDKLIAADPGALLGRAAVERFGPRLPFLLKVLAAGTPLSIQVHPTLDQAREGFAREDAAGIARTAADRNYRDANHKPELLCALTPFTALCGFRPPEQTLALLDELDVPELGFLQDLLRGPDPLRRAFTGVLELPDPAPAIAALTRRATGAQDGPLHAARRAAEHFPHDAGVLLTLLLNDVVLQPGEAIFLGAGNVHAYLHGTGVEIMANSDNVLRCGLTPKHVDVPELLRITDFRPLVEPLIDGTGGRFAAPVPDFALTRLELDEPTGLRRLGPVHRALHRRNRRGRGTRATPRPRRVRRRPARPRRSAAPGPCSSPSTG
jgi:mannose-6-phosphate isomerase, class I